MKTQIKIALLFICLGFILSCSDDLLLEETPQILTTESLYVNFDGFESGINGLYSLAREERIGTASGGVNGLRAEMFMSGTDNMTVNVEGPEFGRLHENWANHNSFHNNTKLIFDWLYSIVNSANTIIDQSEKPNVDFGSETTAEANKNYILAEARAMRAWAYRHLTYGWGDVPLSLKESTGSNIKTNWTRTPVSEVRQQIIKDLRFAENYIDAEPKTQGKLTKGAIQTYLAEIYLAQNQPDSAFFFADKCINTPNYQLVTERYGSNASNPGVPFMDMFQPGQSKRSQGNTESLWTFEFEFGVPGGRGSNMRRWAANRYDQIRVNGVNPFRFTVERGGRGIGRMQPTTYALEAYEPQDDRYSNFAMRQYMILKNEEQNTSGQADRLPDGFVYGDTIFFDPTVVITQANKRSRESYQRPYSRKFDGLLPENGLTESFTFFDQVYLRLAETYLIKAEAELALGRPSDAAQTLNIIRQRSNATPITAADVDIDFILDERSRELFLEEQRRWSLVRTGKWLERVKLHNANGGQTAAARDALSPIPQSVIDANLTSEMRQNDGF